MKNKIFNIAVFLIFILISGCSFLERWENYVSPEGKFSVIMPGEPIGQTIIVDTEVGQTYLYLFTLEKKDSFVYSVSYADYPAELFQKKTTDKILDDARDGLINNVQGRLLKESQISIGKYPARELFIEVVNGTGIVQSRILLVNQRLYELNVVSDKKTASFSNAERFLDSFELIEK